MPENPQKKLSGYVVETSSSDGAITREIVGLRQEISAVVGDPTDTLIGYELSSKNIGAIKRPRGSVQEPQNSAPNVVKLTHKDSALAKSIQHQRVLKKAA